MDILIRDAREKRERLLLDIETLEKEIQDTNLKKAIGRNYDILKNVLQQHQEYIKEKKMRKLRRDANDYAAERVFTFAHKFDNINSDNRVERAPTLAVHTISSITTSDTDLSSCSSVTSEEAISSMQEQRNISHNKSTFLLEMERFRKGTKYNRLAQATHTREPEGGRDKGQSDPNPCQDIDTCDFSIGDIRDIQTLLSIAGEDDSNNGTTFDDILRELGINSSDTCTSGLKPRSRFTPILTSDNSIDVFYKLVTRDLHKLENQYTLGRKTWTHNLSPQEQKALRSFDDIKEIVIKEADKGGNIVVMNRKDYVGEIDRQLQD
ncbi:hypothetical protein NDU88_002222 [Pleurodeles waltl]|uniref:Uncharacterized protein n=1 Tax=Pleurodeles waltl TaxID=8319 RepID=A0AAV7UWD3_PLEWA|nr:hypothetical protein NDU88_002222 [Pleurodeles waltl]